MILDENVTSAIESDHTSEAVINTEHGNVDKDTRAGLKINHFFTESVPSFFKDDVGGFFKDLFGV
ncbi:MAG: hypothetical protein OEY79_01035 [Anaplasmataceae bacterium]|nr:hypothetical protein [Anaplasmataceae bacterium]